MDFYLVWCRHSKSSGEIVGFKTDVRILIYNLNCRCGNFIRADKSLMKAKEFLSPKVFIQEAKILARKGMKEIAIGVLEKGINQYFRRNDTWIWNSQSFENLSPESQETRILCSKAILLSAKLCEEQKLLDKQKYIDKYTQAITVYSESEKNYFTLGSYHDKLWSKDKDNYDIQSKVVKNYCLSLHHGCKYVYQSLPRLLSIWFDHAAQVVELTDKKHSAVEIARRALSQMQSSISKINIDVSFIFIVVFN